MYKIIQILLLIIICQNLSAQCGERYKSRYFNNIQIFRDVVYTKDAPALIAASLTTETTFDKDLVMDIFMPPVTDTVTTRPVIVLAHGGGFINVAFMGGTVLVGTMDNQDVQALADTLAHWGYVTASIEYRLGFNIGSASSVKRAVWRGAQDMSAALRFFRKNANWFGIDPERVFIGGSSAGAFCAIHSTFVDYTERMPESYELVPIFKKDLGALHSRPVVQLTGFNPFSGNNVLGNDVDSIPPGIAAYWGAIADLAWMPQTNKAPMIMFHGTADPIVNYKCDEPFSGVVLTAPITCGSYMMDSVMTAHNIPHEVYYGPGEGHEYWGALNGDWLPSGPNAYWADIIQKTANFFYNIMEPATPQISGPDTVLHSTNYTFSIVNPVPNFTYCWEVTGGVLVSPITNAATVDVQFFNTTSLGFVTARAIDQAEVASENGLAATVVTTNIGIDKIANTSISMNLQPNPAQSSFAINIHSNQAMKSHISIYNTLGQLVLNKNLFLQQGANQDFISIEMFPKGTYFVELQTEKNKVVQKLVVY